MNKSLLLIICDFLLISVLALVEFKPNLPEPDLQEAALIDNSASDLLELLHLSLEHESQQRANIEASLAAKSAALDQTSRTLDETSRALEEAASAKSRLEQTASDLSIRLQQTRSTLELTEAEKARLAESLQQTRSRSEQLQAELRAEQERAKERAAELAAASDNLRALEAQQANLQTELRIRDTEREMLQQNLLAARAEVERARTEAAAAQRRVENLTAGMSELAATSTAIQQEFRQAQALSLNAIYQAFEANRILIRFQWEERRVLGTLTRNATLQSLIVEENGRFYALFSTENTPLNSQHPVTMELQLGNRVFRVSQLARLKANPRLATVQIPAAAIEAAGLRAFSLSANPLRFTEAVLISDNQPVYGEIPLRVPPGEPDFLQVESRLFGRLFGNEYSPRLGDLVFSKSGALIGLIVAPNRAQILQSLEPSDFQNLP